MAIDLQPLTLSDRTQIERAISATPVLQSSPLSMLAFAPHYIWRHQFRFFLSLTNGWVVLFAEYADGIYAPLPPLRSVPIEGASVSFASYAEILGMVFDFMKEQNGGTLVSRIENIPEELKDEFQSAGYQLRPKDSDYLYRTEDLVHLKGDRYKSQRAACNQFIRSHTPIFEPYFSSAQDACLALFDQWAEQKQQVGPSDQGDAPWWSQAMLEDSRRAHEEVFAHAEELGLMGRVVRVGETVSGYTFGYARNTEVFCVLIEVADRVISGLAQYLFRELCRECSNYEFINTMDDSGLSSLAHSKRAYHPSRLVSNYIATMGT